MAEIRNGSTIKTIAFYLPQFHAIPENDKAWGKGFTEWTNTRKAKPLFDGHYQPKTPLNENYYNLLDDNVKVWQSNLAQKYGVFGFCYYHYWFKDGKQLLEKPAEQMLKNKMVTIPFCFSWANENWSKRWDGGNQELIAEQEYGYKEDWKQHLNYLLPFFKDERYITLDGKPVFLIYKPEEIPRLKEMLEYWQTEVKKAGFKGICFMIQNSSWYYTPTYNMEGFSYQIKFQPHDCIRYQSKNLDLVKKLQKVYFLLNKIHCGKFFASLRNKAVLAHRLNKVEKQDRREYEQSWETIIQSEARKEMIEGAFVDWDNTARKQNGMMHLNATPEKFEYYMKRLFRKIKEYDLLPVVFINAWNEWGEGAYLEPDTMHEYRYLEALKAAEKDAFIM